MYKYCEGRSKHMSKISRKTVILASFLIIMIICMRITYGISNDVYRISFTKLKSACEFATDFAIVFFTPSKCRNK